jgi:membrane associated rhomboid family serine protease
LSDLRPPPLINSPWPALALTASIPLSYGVQSVLLSPSLVDRFAVSGAALSQGDVVVLVTSLWLHAGWAHALGNAVFCLAFATPVARRMGPDAKGVIGFFTFYLVCGAFSGACLALAHWAEPVEAIGASGAIAGLMGAASRLLTRGPGLAPFTSSTVIGMAVMWVVVNLLFGRFLVGWAPGSDGVPIAWEAHVGGYAAGLLLISPALRLLRRL